MLFPLTIVTTVRMHLKLLGADSTMQRRARFTALSRLEYNFFTRWGQDVYGI
jgi:hypothetical protein